MNPNRGTPDFLLLFLTLGMVGFGIVMIFSASFTISYWNMGNRWYFTQRQLQWAGIGFIAMSVAMNIPFRAYKEKVAYFFLGSIVLLLFVFLPGIGQVRNTAHSWIGFGNLTIQPAEFAKLGLILYLAALMAKKGNKMRSFKQGLLPPLIISLFVFGLIALQPDYGTGMILLLTAGVMIIVAGANLKHIVYLALGGGGILSVLIFSAGYRAARFTSFMNPWKDPWGSGYHLIQSLIALGNGGVFGTGFGKGIQKFFYLPYPQSDFIFSVMGEELGLIGVTLFILIYLFLLWRALIVSLRSKDSFGALVGVGIVTLLGLQAFINIGGVIGAIPITGVPLPFISAGGSALIMAMTAMGILLSLSRENNKNV
ncbi:putative lipid II flippase FtsW [Tepidibacillus marianensis]|uniref:putative lipid II flippase FtsW n=1 Tax=Tepidibacillus marianensis TaxID=3131995 RepID=UPI0030CC4B56